MLFPASREENTVQKTLRVDQDACISCGLCVTNVPEVFRFADHGKAEVYDSGGSLRKHYPAGGHRHLSGLLHLLEGINEKEIDMNIFDCAIKREEEARSSTKNWLRTLPFLS